MRPNENARERESVCCHSGEKMRKAEEYMKNRIRVFEI